MASRNRLPFGRITFANVHSPIAVPAIRPSWFDEHVWMPLMVEAWQPA